MKKLFLSIMLTIAVSSSCLMPTKNVQAIEPNIVSTPVASVAETKTQSEIAGSKIVDPITYTYFTNLTGTTYTSHKFICYHPLTTSWSPATQYTLTSGVTVGTSVTGSTTGFSGTVSTSLITSAGVTLKADGIHNSRVGIYADFTNRSYRIDRVKDNTGAVVSSTYTTVSTPTNTYQSVVYQ